MSPAAGFSRVEVLREGMRNLRARPVATALTVLLAVTLGAAVSLFAMSEVRSARGVWRAQVAAGLTTLSVTPAGQGGAGGVPAARCEAARQIAGVVSAGAVSGVRRAHPSTDPGTTISILEVTPGFIRVVHDGGGPTGRESVVIGRDLAATLGLTEGSAMAWSDIDSGVAAQADAVTVASSGAMREAYDAAVLVTVPASGTVAECLVRADPGQEVAVAAALAGWFPGQDLRVRPELAVGTFTTDARSALAHRTSQWAALLGGVVVALAVGVTSWSRRQELAVYRLLAMPRGMLRLLLTTEVALAVWLPALLAMLWVTALVSRDLTVDGVAAPYLRDLVLWWVGAVLAPLLGWSVALRVAALDTGRGR